ncbi:MAG: efflux RND transporter periplasmic adaptor subunit [Acidobacteriota bacterium]
MRVTCLCFILLLAAGCSRKEEQETEAVAPVQVAAVRREPIREIVRAEAILYPRDQAGLTPKISAPVRMFYVNRGDHVRKGQLLAVLENRDLAAAALESKAQYDQAQAAYHSTTAASLPQELAKAELDAEAAAQALDASKKLYESRDQLFREGALARRLVDEAHVAYVQARAQSENARKHLASLERVEKEQTLKGAAAQLEAAKGHYESASAQLSYSEIRSPLDGVVTDRPLYAGEMAGAGTPLLTVMDISQVVARASVPERDAARVKAGDEAAIAQDGGAELPGKVVVVSPAVDPSSTTVQVWVRAANPAERLKPGASVQVSIVAATVPDAVVVPPPALLPSNSVLVVGSDSTVHEKKVEVGIREPDKVQILRGLEPGERVVTVGGLGLPDGAKVRIER